MIINQNSKTFKHNQKEYVLKTFNHLQNIIDYYFLKLLSMYKI